MDFLDDREWLLKIKANDPEAILALWEMLYRDGETYARRHGMAEDIGYSAAVNTYRILMHLGALEAFRYKSKFRSYCYTILAHEIIRLAKEEQAKAPPGIPIDPTNDSDQEKNIRDIPQPIIEETLDVVYFMGEVERCLGKLSSRDREILERFYFRRQDPKVIAQDLELSRVTVNIANYRSRVLLRKCLEERGFISSDDFRTDIILDQGWMMTPAGARAKLEQHLKSWYLKHEMYQVILELADTSEMRNIATSTTEKIPPLPDILPLSMESVDVPEKYVSSRKRNDLIKTIIPSLSELYKTFQKPFVMIVFVIFLIGLAFLSGIRLAERIEISDTTLNENQMKQQIQKGAETCSSTLLIDTWPRYPLILMPSEQRQMIYVQVVNGCKQPIEGAPFDLSLVYPDGTVIENNFPLTDTTGKATITLEPVIAPEGTIVSYDACYLEIPEKPICISGVFTLWEITP